MPSNNRIDGSLRPAPVIRALDTQKLPVFGPQNKFKIPLDKLIALLYIIIIVSIQSAAAKRGGTKIMASYHKSNLGDFGNSLVVDQNGYTHTTIKEWLAAPVDWGFNLSAADKRDMARQRAADARVALAEANRAAAKWQQENR